jgi:DNA primase
MASVAAAKAQLSIVEVIREHVPLLRQAARYIGRCPFHEDRGRPNLVVFPATQTWACFACGAQGDVLDFLSRIRGQSIREVLQRMAVGEGAPPQPVPHTVMGDAVRIDAGLRAWLRTLPLSAAHVAQLRARGFAPETLGRYRTHRPGPAPDTVAGAPGFFQTPSGTWWAHGPAGLLVPILDPDDRVAGAQIRVDQHGARYRWLSSGGLPGGVASGSPCHVAQGVGDTLWVTEGPLKADLARDRLGVTVLGLAGVSTWRKAWRLAVALKPRLVVIAFDQDPDPATCAVVRAQADVLSQACRDSGLPVARASWNGPAKGLDDALRGGAAISVDGEGWTSGEKGVAQKRGSLEVIQG